MGSVYIGVQETYMSATEKFHIKDKIAVITGGAGLLGRKHAEAVI